MGRPFNKFSRGRGGGGQSSGRSGGSWRGRRGGGRGGGAAGAGQLKTVTEGTRDDDRIEDARVWDELDHKLGFAKFQEGLKRQGWLVNMKETLVPDDSKTSARAGVDYYFIQDDGGMFKATLAYEPYFYLATRSGYEGVVEEWLIRKYEDLITKVSRVRKEDLKLPNHLMGYRRDYISLAFRNQTDLFTVRRDLLPLATKNREMLDAVDTYAEVVAGEQKFGQVGMEYDMEDGFGGEGFVKNVGGAGGKAANAMDPKDAIIDIREYDVPYYLRVAIDKNIRVGLWYEVTADAGEISFRLLEERVARAEPVVMAFDIETTKAPLKFPDQLTDQVMMISYMIDGQGFLITNREIVGADIEDFEYTPKPDYEGPFTIFNEADEAATILRFFEHFREARPTVCATYNGDSFDFPFLLARANIHGIDMYNEIGFAKDNEDEFKSRSCVHMDCFRWVKRDSYLPQGSQGLKAVTVAKLGYNPIELDPELMTPYAADQPQTLAQYSVSDAVATYYLYMKYVHPFVFSLCNIIPLNPDEVLRKGSGTLCETLLMVEAYRSNVVYPNRHVESHNNMYDGHLLESETYVGGHVEALEAGVFRSDIETDFKIVPSAIQELIDDLDDALQFALAKEGKKPIPLEDVENYDEVKGEIVRMLEELRDRPLRADTPLIYHLDVAAMYPNIMLSNRLQPDSVVTEADCAACDFNRPGKQCQRRMKWAWRGEYFPARLNEYKMIRNALEQETFPPKWPGKPERRFSELSPSEQTSLLHKRLGDYSRKVYAKTKETKIETKEAIICQRENPFYIDTVRTFRDRRYTYKGLHKDWKKKLDQANGGGGVQEIVEAKAMIVLYDSLQLAHKCILNSFYGYVMRKGARWHSMEMAGITCLTGASIIQMARKLVEQIGRPLELDTDGIWCMLPSTFPDGFAFKLHGGGKFPISYPCTMLNHIVHKDFTNDQYHEATPDGRHVVREENSIFFELDGPYRAMILPSSKEEDKLLKKRYAVFNEDGSLAELKGFEVKRRGELQLIKTFQSQIFEKFLLGGTLKDCYAAVATVADKWLDVLFTKAVSLPDDELVELIAENRSMSKTLAEYAGQKSTSISTARRLAEFLGEQMVKDKGLACKFIISTKPVGAPVTERAVPVAIFSAELSVKRHFLRKWLKDNALEEFDLRSILDWDYYIERLGSVVQKLITIPAALQKIPNPVPRIRHPDWLHRRVANQDDKFKQHRVDEMFARQKPAVRDVEDIGSKDLIVVAPRETTPPPPAAPKPDFTRSYSAWIAYMKPIWREQRKQLLASQKSSSGFTGRAGTLGSMMHQRSTFLSSAVWDIVQITPVADRPGEFKMWLLIADSLQSVRLRIPRQFFVNFVELPTADGVFPEGCEVEPFSRSLPRGQRSLNLVRLSTSEDDFVRDEPLYGELLNGPNVDGVYELQVPLVMRALLHLGSSCIPDSRKGVTLNKGLDRHFALDDLKPAEATLSKRRYLDLGRNLRYTYLFHVTNDYRHVFGLFMPTGTAKVYVVERGKARDVQNLDKYYEEQLKRRKEAEAERLKKDKSAKREVGAFEYADKMTMIVAYAGNEDVAFRHISRDLDALSKQKSMASLLVVHSPKPRSYFDEKVRGAANFPLIAIQSSKAENTFPTALAWQAPACRRMVQHYLRAAVWIRERIELADRFDVPVCNLEKDVPLFLADIDFARRLAKADCVLWWSPAARPDLGGREADANASQLGDELVNPELGKPGCYSNACLEVEVRNLAVDAVLQSALVYELEGGEGGGIDEAAHNLDDYAKGTAHAPHVLGDAILPTSTFNMVRAMVKAWSVEAAKPDGAHWRLMLDHFWRWTSSPAAKLYDPALYRFVHGLMRKTFSQLLAEFRRLGSDIVHADFGRIFLLTGKPSSSTAYAYANYLVSSVTTRELFRYVQLEIVRFWDQLVWMDAANSAGIVCPRPDLDEQPLDRVEVEMQFNVATYLPDAVQDDFTKVVGRFVHGMLVAKRQQSADLRTPLRILQNGLETVERGKANGDEDGDNDAKDPAKTLISETLTRQLLKAVTRLKDAYAEKDDPEAFEFPQLPGSHLRPKNPVLEFIKTTCAVLALAKDVSEEVVILKRNLLDLIGVREFAKEAIFVNPCLPFKVPMVVCRSCNSIRGEPMHLDLCRNVAFLVKDQPWLCERCSAEYDCAAIEALIIDSLQRRLVSYQLQDLRCGKCKTMKSENLRSHCDCSGEYQMSEMRQDLVKRLQVTSKVADFHNLQVLATAVEWMQELVH
ncbi:DNA polymerase epsilon catalytic subunit A [Rhodotorula toruloides]|uniref:DNA polymerase epsilon catalytic subunit n=1 Tax=Rhodotorula toruloides TaxID=5286 RepID=A0A511KLT0_RHOTO|nr:DNA polymerase epsilon catalytic subunit A [Rhodotorula toruloides]